ncbi:MAG: DUF134 domain-containing protein [DPANN group archaeon]|nr:DUF134 domain-containing protein [DPANN group archaeon]
MVRPRKLRRISQLPKTTYFKPRSVPVAKLERVDVSFDELEAMRLVDLDGLDQSTAAEKMQIHQSTLHRSLMAARRAVVDALVNGKAIRIQGGAYTMPDGDNTGPGAERGGQHLQRRVRGSSSGGPGGICRCTKCGYEMLHKQGTPCFKERCPTCHVPLERKSDER